MTATHRHPWTAALLLALLAAAVACELEPDVGAPLRDRCVDDDGDPDREVRFRTDILEGIFARETAGCLSCHDPAAATPIGVTVGGLDLTSHAALVAGGVNSGADIVVPGAPCRSALYRKVGAGPPFGARMPADGPPFLSEADIALIHDWIAEGARDD